MLRGIKEKTVSTVLSYYDTTFLNPCSVCTSLLNIVTGGEAIKCCKGDIKNLED